MNVTETSWKTMIVCKISGKTMIVCKMLGKAEKMVYESLKKSGKMV